MKALSDTLQAMKLPEGSAKGPPLGSTMTAGLPTILQRQNPLTESQLMAIASETLRGGFSLTFEKRTKFGPKTIDGVVFQNEPIGEENAQWLVADFVPNCQIPLINAALAMSPKECTLKHLLHLAIHKKFGSSEEDRAVMLKDYTDALEGVPEFILYTVCKHYWTKDKRPFMPFVAEIRETCDLLQQAFENKRKPAKMLEQHVVRPQPCYDTDKNDPRRKAWCDFLNGLGKENCKVDYDNAKLYSNYALERWAVGYGFGKEPEIAPKTDSVVEPKA